MISIHLKIIFIFIFFFFKNFQEIFQFCRQIFFSNNLRIIIKTHHLSKTYLDLILLLIVQKIEEKFE